MDTSTSPGDASRGDRAPDVPLGLRALSDEELYKELHTRSEEADAHYRLWVIGDAESRLEKYHWMRYTRNLNHAAAALVEIRRRGLSAPLVTPDILAATYGIEATDRLAARRIAGDYTAAAGDA